MANTRASDIEEIRRSISAVSDIADRLSSAVTRQDNSTREVMNGLEQMKSLAARIAALDSLPPRQDESFSGNINA